MLGRLENGPDPVVSSLEHRIATALLAVCALPTRELPFGRERLSQDYASFRAASENICDFSREASFALAYLYSVVTFLSPYNLHPRVFPRFSYNRKVIRYSKIFARNHVSMDRGYLCFSFCEKYAIAYSPTMFNLF